MTDEREQQLARIAERLDDIQLSTREIRMIYKAQAARLERLESVVFGNGRPGLATQVRAILWIASGCLAFLILVVVRIVSAWIGIA